MHVNQTTVNYVCLSSSAEAFAISVESLQKDTLNVSIAA